MLIKTFAIGLALIGLPLGYLIWYWSQLNRVVRFLIALYLAVMLVLIYPIGSFLWSMIKVEEVFPENCRSALKLSKGYAEKPYSKFGTIIIGSLFRVTPRDYFLSTIGICEYEVAHYGSAVVAFEELLKESSSLDIDSRQKVKKALAKARSRLSENEKPKPRMG